MDVQKTNLSYYLTTFQKLPYLKIVLEDLIKNRLADEEIVISDGGSKDGTTEYLQQLFNEGQIQYFVSEKDKGESHGMNRALLACKGKILKVMTDDDVYCFDAIKECKQYMLLNEDLDLLGADGFDNYTGTDLEFIDHQKYFVNWMATKLPFGFYGPGLFIRKSSLPLTGLFNCLTKFIDTEYTYRATSLPIKLGWYKKPLFVRIINQDSNTLKFLKQVKVERDLYAIYQKIATGKSIQEFKRKRAINLIKRKIYDLIYSRSSTIKKEKYTEDILVNYNKCKEILLNSFQRNTSDPFIKE